MKKIVVFMILIFILSACNVNTCSNNAPVDSNNLYSAKFDEENSLVINLHNWQYYNNQLTAANKDEEALKKIDTWEDQISDKFGVTFKLNIQPMNRENISTYIRNNNIDGLFLINYYELEALAKNGLITPITNNFIRYGLNNIYSESLLEDITYNNDIYIIPSRYSKCLGVTTREIRNDWLIENDLKKPNNIDELYEMLLCFTYNDPDHNNINDTIGAFSFKLEGLHDVFQAYGMNMRLMNNHTILCPINWNYKNEQFEDAMYSENAEACFNYIKQLYVEKIIKFEFESTRFTQQYKENYNNTVGSFYVDDNTINYVEDISSDNSDVEFVSVFSLSYNGNKGTVYYFDRVQSGYVLLDSTTEKEQTINSFISTFINKYNGYIQGLYGISKDETKNGDYYCNNGKIYKTSEEYLGVIFNNPYFDNISINQINSINNIINYNSTYIRNDNILANLDRVNIIENLENSYFMPKDIISIYDNNSLAYIWQDLVEDNFNVITSNMIKGNISFIAGLNEYKNILSIAGIDNLVEELNNDIN